MVDRGKSPFRDTDEAANVSQTAARGIWTSAGAASGGTSPEGFLIKSFARKSWIMSDGECDVFARAKVRRCRDGARCTV